MQALRGLYFWATQDISANTVNAGFTCWDTHLDPVLLQLLNSVVCHEAILALRLLTKVVLLPAGKCGCLNYIPLSIVAEIPTNSKRSAT